MEQHFYKTTIYTPNGIKTSGFWWPPKPEPVMRPINSTTGLASLSDFINEARKLGISDPMVFKKFTNYFARKEAGTIGEGMCRMQCNALIKNAVKRK